jgi:hypothetical protein
MIERVDLLTFHRFQYHYLAEAEPEGWRDAKDQASEDFEQFADD